jgi:adenylate kinase
MNIIIMGPPGSGKGSQAQVLKSQFNLLHLSTGDILREEATKKTEFSQALKSKMEHGELIDDAIILSIVSNFLKRDECKFGFILDGFPRTLSQATALTELGVHIDLVIELNVPDESIIERLCGRRVHQSSGRIYHMIFNPPKEDGLDDLTREPLLHRDDDRVDVIMKRLALYKQETQPITHFYKTRSNNQLVDYICMDVEPWMSREDVTERLLYAMHQKKRQQLKCVQSQMSNEVEPH